MYSTVALDYSELKFMSQYCYIFNLVQVCPVIRVTEDLWDHLDLKDLLATKDLQEWKEKWE